MKEVRVSIPVIGGVTVVYTQQEINEMKQSIKHNVMLCSSFVYRMTTCGIAKASRFGSSTISAIANRIQTQEVK